MPYATRDELKAILGITGTGEDTVLDLMLEAASDYIDRTTGSFFSPVTTTRYYDYQDRNILWLDRPLHSLTSVTNGDGTTLTTTEVRPMPLAGPPYVWLETRWSSGVLFTPGTSGGESAHAVTGVWGHLDASGNTPSAIRDLTLRVAAIFYNQRQYGGLESARMGDTSFRFRDEVVPAELREEIIGFRFPRFRG